MPLPELCSIPASTGLPGWCLTVYRKGAHEVVQRLAPQAGQDNTHGSRGRDLLRLPRCLPSSLTLNARHRRPAPNQGNGGAPAVKRGFGQASVLSKNRVELRQHPSKAAAREVHILGLPAEGNNAFPGGRCNLMRLRVGY